MIRVSCNSLESYYNYLFSHQDEINKFIDGFNINYTYFFRDWEVFKTFQDLLLECLDQRITDFAHYITPSPFKLKKFHTKKNYIKNQSKKNKKDNNLDPFISNVLSILNPLSIFQKIKSLSNTKKTINIWSAPCASGEEVYSLAMILDNLEEKIPKFPKYRLVGTDIDKDAIDKAKQGKYDEMSMKEISEFFKTKYFKKKETHFGFSYEIDKKIKNKVEFYVEDLTKGHLKPWDYDIIFCRYLLIYFNRNNKNRFLKIIENKLNVGGLLVIGKTETLFNKHPVLKIIDEKNHIYIKSS